MGGFVWEEKDSLLTQGNGSLSSLSYHSLSQTPIHSPLGWPQLCLQLFQLTCQQLPWWWDPWWWQFPRHLHQWTGHTMTFATHLRGWPQWSQPQEKHSKWGKYTRWCSLTLLLLPGHWSALALGESDTSRSRWRSEMRRIGRKNIATILSKSGVGALSAIKASGTCGLD